MEIEFRDDPADCNGHDGLFQSRYTPWRVTVCRELPYVLTHELAHAWEAANLDDADRNRYLELRGLTTWRDHDVSRGDRGIEDAAFMLQQNLMAGRVDVESDRWIERARAFEALTGRTSPVLASNEPGTVAAETRRVVSDTTCGRALAGLGSDRLHR